MGLSKLKEQRQTVLLNLGNDLLGNLEIKYAPYLNDEIKAIWEEQMMEFVSFYEDNADKVEDDALFKEKKKEVRDAWNEIFELIEEDYNEAAAEREEAKKDADRQKKLEALRAQGLNIGAGTTKREDAASKKAKAKREEREKLKVLRAILREKDKLAVQEEKKRAEREKIEQELAKKKEIARLEREKKEKEAMAKAKAESDDDWDDSSSDDDVPDKARKNGGAKKGNKATNNALADSSGDEDVPPPKKQQAKKVTNDPFGSDD